jgi:PAS domain S-box-containing protein
LRAECERLGAELQREREARQLAEERLVQRKERLRAAQNYGGVGVWTWDLVKGEVSVEPEFELLYGVQPGTFRGYEDWAKLIDPEDLKVGESIRERALKERRSFEISFKIRTVHGEVRWLLSRGRGEYDEQGNLRRVVGVNVDITEQKRVQEELALTSERLQLAQRAAGIGVFDWFVQTGVVIWSAEEERLFGLEPGSFEGTIEGWSHRVHELDRERIQKQIAAAMAKKQRVLDFDFRIVRADGQVRWIEGSGRFLYNEKNEPVRMVGVNIDVTERREAQSALEASAMRLRRIIDSNVVGLLLADFQGRITEVNDAFLRIVGYTREDFAEGRINWVELTPPEHRHLDQQAMKLMETVGQHPPFEKEYTRKDGSRVPVLVGTAYLPDESLGVGFIVDLSAQKRAEAALRASEARLRTLAEAVPALVWVTAPNGFVLYLNARWSEYTGQTEEQYRGFGWADVVHPEDRARVLAMWEKATSTGSTYEGEARYRSKDGDYRWHFFRAVPARDDQQRIVAWYGASVDIHDKKGVEEALRKSEQHFREIADTAPAILWITDARGYCSFLSRNWYEYTGQGVEESLGLGWTNAVHPEDRAKTEREFISATSEKRIYVSEYRLRGRDGNYRWVIDSARPRLSASGEFIGMVGSVIDVHERKLAEDQLRQTNQELDRKVQERTARLQETIGELEAFSYSVSHDLRAPLRAMTGYAQVLAEDCAQQLDAEHQEYLVRIQRAARRLEGLINDVLHYSRMSRTEVELTRVELTLILEDIVTNYPSLQPDRAKILIHSPLPAVLGHEALLSQALSNLLVNAVKFVGPGVYPEVHVRARPIGDRVRVEIQDNGIGIAPHNLSRVFELFQRVNPDGAYEGTGIGLSIVKKAVERLGGNVGVESELGKGSIFWVELPGAV